MSSQVQILQWFLGENGKERILSKEEIDKLVADEAKKIDNGTSNLTNPHGNGWHELR